MKRLFLCVGVLGLSLHTTHLAKAQHSLPTYNIYQIHQQSRDALAENYIALEHRLAPPRLYLNAEQEGYLRQLTAMLSGRELTSNPSAISLPDIDEGRIDLLKAIRQYQVGEEHQALALLQKVRQQGLYAYEVDQLMLLSAYLSLKNQAKVGEIKRSKAYLERVMQRDNLLGEQARLYMSHLLWHERKPQEAQRLLEQGEWSKSILPEVEYSGALLSYDLDEPSVALRNTQNLLSLYPQMRERPRLLGLMAYTYYKLGDYQQAIARLSEVQSKQALSPTEYYTLGAAYYELKRYDEAIPALQQATLQEGTVAALAQFALGNIYQYRGEHRLAQLAFASAADDARSSHSLREQALYRQIELGYATGYDVFGSQLRVVERLLSDYPNSQYKPRVLDIVRSQIGRSTNYPLALNLISQLQKYGLKLGDLKQEIYFKQALQSQDRVGEYEHLLGQTIAQGHLSPAYALALTARAELRLKQNQYKQAEADARQALSVDIQPKDVKHSSYLLAYSLFNQQRYTEAAQSFLNFVGTKAKTPLHRDAYLRLGDCYLATKQNGLALKYYHEADQCLTTGSDEALYRIAHLYSKQGQHKQAIEQVNLAVSKFPESPYLPQLLYDKGRAERLLGNTSAALSTFGSLATSYPVSSVAPTALLERALIYTNLDEDNKAIEAYKQVLQKYPQSAEAQTALADLKSLYTEQNRQEDYLAYVKGLGSDFKPSNEEEAQLRYQALEQRVQRGDKPIRELEAFVQQYPDRGEGHSARLMLAKIYADKGDTKAAINLIKVALDKPMPTEDKLRSLLTLAKLHQEQEQLSEAYQYYLASYQQAKGSQLYSLQAGLGVLHTARQTQQYAEAISLAKELLKRTNLSTREREELTLLQGRAEEHSKGFNAAVATYSKLAQATDSPYGAEATVRRADILYRLGKYKECQGVLDTFIASGSNQDYWVARAFILLSDNYNKLGDKYIAKQYIESLKENYSGSEDDIHQLIEERLTKYNK